MLARLPYAAWLVFVWCALWGSASPANLLGGAGVAAALLVLFPDAGPGPVGRVRPVALLRFLGWFAWKLFEANLVVAWEVVSPRSRINEGIVAVPVVGASDSVVTFVANAISLTPGTLTLEVRRDPCTLYVHVLHLRSVADTRADIQRLEELALAAIAPPEVLATLRDSARQSTGREDQEVPR